MTKDEALKLALEALDANYLLVNGTETHGGLEQCMDGYYSGCFDTDSINKQTEEAITAIKEALVQEQEPVAMRMPKVGDKVICIEDDSLGEVEYLTAGGSPEIKFDDGSHGTYMLREFAELFRYATTPHTKVGCAECGVNGNHALYCVACAEKYLEDKNTKGQK